MAVNHTKFLRYDKDENGELVINEKQAKIVKRIYTDYLDGKGPNRIARELEKEGVPKLTMQQLTILLRKRFCGSPFGKKYGTLPTKD